MFVGIYVTLCAFFYTCMYVYAYVRLSVYGDMYAFVRVFVLYLYIGMNSFFNPFIMKLKVSFKTFNLLGW